MSGHRFVIVEFPATDTPLAGFTARNPGTTVDIIMEPMVEEDVGRVHHSIALIKGTNPEALTALLQNLGKVYDHIEPIERDDGRRIWLGRIRVREDSYTHNPGAKAMVHFQHRYGAQWYHVEAGIAYLRARITDQAHGDVLADQMRRHLAEVGVEAQVEVRDISPKDYGVWEDLVQRSIGLAP